VALAERLRQRCQHRRQLGVTLPAGLQGNCQYGKIVADLTAGRRCSTSRWALQVEQLRAQVSIERRRRMRKRRMNSNAAADGSGQ
jgi:hypothetical protein